jgi:hypothetical protein
VLRFTAETSTVQFVPDNESADCPIGGKFVCAKLALNAVARLPVAPVISVRHWFDTPGVNTVSLAMFVHAAGVFVVPGPRRIGFCAKTASETNERRTDRNVFVFM